MISPKHIAAIGLALLVVFGASNRCAASPKGYVVSQREQRDSLNTQYIELTDDKGNKKAEAWPGQVIALRPKNTSLEVVGCFSDTPEIAEVKNSRGGLVLFLRPGVAIFRVEVMEDLAGWSRAHGFRRGGQKGSTQEAAHRIVSYSAYVEVKGADLVIEPSSDTVAVFPGQVKQFSAQVLFPLTVEEQEIDNAKFAPKAQLDSSKVASRQLSSSKGNEDGPDSLEQIKTRLQAKKGALLTTLKATINQDPLVECADRRRKIDCLEEKLARANNKYHSLKAEYIKLKFSRTNIDKKIKALEGQCDTSAKLVDNLQSELDKVEKELEIWKSLQVVNGLIERAETDPLLGAKRQEPQQPRAITYSLDDQDKVQLSKDGKTWATTVSAMPNDTIMIRGVTKGLQKLRLESSGLLKEVEVTCYVPSIEYSDVPDELLEGVTRCVKAKLKVPKSANSDDFIVKTEVGESDSTDTEGSIIRICPKSQKPVKLKTSVFYKVTGGAVEISNGQLEIAVRPVAKRMSIRKMRNNIVIGDKISFELDMWDKNGDAIKWKDHGEIEAWISKTNPQKHDRHLGLDRVASEMPMACISEDGDKGYLQFNGVRPGQEYTINFKVSPNLKGYSKEEIARCAVQTERTRVQFIEPLEIRAKLVGDSRHAKDLFSSQVIKEFEVFELLLKNNLSQAESDKYTQVSEIQVNGNTLLIPVAMSKKEKKPKNVSGQASNSANCLTSIESDRTSPGQEDDLSDYILESSPKDIARFVQYGLNNDSINVYLPAVGKEELDSVMDAIQDREPGNALANIIATIDSLLSVLNTAFPEYIHWLYVTPGNGDPKSISSIAGNESTARKLIVEFLGVQFQNYRKRVSRTSKVAMDQMLTSSYKVAKNKESRAYFLFPRDAWRSLCKSADIKVSFYPKFRAVVSYDFLLAGPESKSSP